MKWTTIGIIALSLTTWMASKCDDDIPICTTKAPMDQVVVSVTPQNVNMIPEGAYLLQFFLDDNAVEIEWSMSNIDGRSLVTVQDKTEGYFYGIRIHETDMIDATISFLCPETPIQEIDATLSLNGVQIADFAIIPVYGENQPTEPNGNDCGDCWRLNLGVQTLLVPSM